MRQYFFLLLVFFVSCSAEEKRQAQEKLPAQPKGQAAQYAQSPIVPTHMVPEETPAKNVSPLVYTTSLMVENDVEVKSRLTGIIEEIYVERGSHVKKGSPLARLQNNDLQLELEKAKIQMEESEAEFKRAESLFNERLLSESEYDARRLAYDSAKAGYELAKVEYEKSIIRAPFTGIVVERTVKLGQRVVEDENVSLFRIAGMEPLLARIFVPEQHLRQISVGQPVVFVPTVPGDKHYEARVQWISPVVDPAAGTAAIIVEIRSRQRGSLKPGTSGKVIVSNSNDIR